MTIASACHQARSAQARDVTGKAVRFAASIVSRWRRLLARRAVAFGAVPLTAENWPQWRGPAAERPQRRDESARSLVEDREHRLEARAARVVGIDADRLGRPHLSQRGGGPQSVAVVRRSRARRRALEAAARRRQHADAEAEHVVAVAGDRRPARLGDDRHRRDQGVRLRGQGALDARHPEGLRRIRPAVGLRLVAAAVRGFAVRAGAARQ